jgi:hypothetical protein
MPAKRIQVFHEKQAASAPGKRFLQVPLVQEAKSLKIPIDEWPSRQGIFYQLSSLSGLAVSDVVDAYDKKSGETTATRYSNRLGYYDGQGRFLTKDEYHAWLVARGCARLFKGQLWLEATIGWETGESTTREPRDMREIFKRLDPAVVPPLVLAMQDMRIEAGVKQSSTRVDLTREVVESTRGDSDTPFLRGFAGVARRPLTNQLIYNYWENGSPLTMLGAVSVTSYQQR